MPGHIKLGKPGEPDPDPAPYLCISMEMKRADMLKPYDPKKSYWCPDGKGGYAESMLEDDNGTKATVMCGHEVSFTLTFEIEILRAYFSNYYTLQIKEGSWVVVGGHFCWRMAVF